jgi:hypothetical protein
MRHLSTKPGQLQAQGATMDGMNGGTRVEGRGQANDPADQDGRLPDEPEIERHVCS